MALDGILIEICINFHTIGNRVLLLPHNRPLIQLVSASARLLVDRAFISDMKIWHHSSLASTRG